MRLARTDQLSFDVTLRVKRGEAQELLTSVCVTHCNWSGVYKNTHIFGYHCIAWQCACVCACVPAKVLESGSVTLTKLRCYIKSEKNFFGWMICVCAPVQEERRERQHIKFCLCLCVRANVSAEVLEHSSATLTKLQRCSKSEENRSTRLLLFFVVLSHLCVCDILQEERRAQQHTNLCLVVYKKNLSLCERWHSIS